MKIPRWQFLANLVGSLFVSYASLEFLFFRSANPVQLLTLRTGRSAIALILLTLACSPLKTLFGLTFLLKTRKTLGIYAFLLAAFHFLTYFGLDYQFKLKWVIPELLGKSFLQIGILALFLLFLLALSSPTFIRKRLRHYWTSLHKLIYPASMLALLHMGLAIKGDYLRLAVPLIVLVLLLAMRILPIFRFNKWKEIPFLKKVNDYLLESFSIPWQK